MIKNSLAFGIGMAWIAFWVGAAVADIGEVAETLTPTPGWMPAALLALTGFPFILGFFAGKE